MTTRLTINVDPTLRRQVKARAALEGRTVSAVVRERLEEYAARLDLVEEEADIRALDEIEKRIATGEERLRDWDEVDAELDGLPD